MSIPTATLNMHPPHLIRIHKYQHMLMGIFHHPLYGPDMEIPMWCWGILGCMGEAIPG